MKSKKFASVWDAVEDTAEEAENMPLRSELMAALNRKIETSSISQASAAKMFGVTQPRISDLRRGKIDLFSLDPLVKMATGGLRLCRPPEVMKGPPTVEMSMSAALSCGQRA